MMDQTMVNPTPGPARAEEVRQGFAEANQRLIARLRSAEDAAAERCVEGRWSAAQIGWHVAAVTTRFAGMISGEIPAAQPLEAGFRARVWTDVAAAIPDRLEAPAAVAPPGSVGRADAVAALEVSGERMARALDALTEARGDGMGVVHPIVGAISVHQIAEWATAHVIRHNRQAKRALGQG